MSFDDDLNACAALVERGDPLRFRAAMAAPVAARRLLFPLYAFNFEVARAPWLTKESMIAEMRLQWWRDICTQIAQGEAVRRHEVATPLAKAVTSEDAALLDELVAARRWDIYRDPFEDTAHLERYIDQTSGNLTWVAVRRLGAANEAVVRDAAYAAGIAGWLKAIPELEAAGRIPLLDGTADGLRDLAGGALKRLEKARTRRGAVSRAATVGLLHIGAAAPVLRAAIADPRRVALDTLPDPVQVDRLRIGWRALTGRW